MSITIDIGVLELVCAHFCHDLISPLTAINNGLELLQDSDEAMSGEALQLVMGSAAQASRKLTLLRLAYGPGGKSGSVPLEYTQSLIQGYFEGSKIAIEWLIRELPETLPPETCWPRMLALMALLAEGALAYGGTLQIETDSTQEKTILIIRALGRSAGLREEMQKALTRETAIADLSASQVHAYVTTYFSQAFGWILTTENLEDGQWVFRAEFKA